MPVIVQLVNIAVALDLLSVLTRVKARLRLTMLISNLVSLQQVSRTFQQARTRAHRLIMTGQG